MIARLGLALLATALPLWVAEAQSLKTDVADPKGILPNLDRRRDRDQAG
jgi:hypothetical protein